METSDTEGATFNVYYGTSSGVYSTVLEGVTAGQRDASIVGLQTYGDARGIGRYVKIEGIPGSGGQFSLAEVSKALANLEGKGLEFGFCVRYGPSRSVCRCENF